MSSARLVRCPSCEREIRVTEDELAAKRSFCAVCDARFDLVPELFAVQGGPLRQHTPIITPVPRDAVPDEKLELTSDGRVLRIHHAGRPSVLFAIFGIAWLAFAGNLTIATVQRPSVQGALVTALFAGAGLLIVAKWFAELWGGVDISITRDEILVTSRGIRPSCRAIPHNSFVRATAGERTTGETDVEGIVELHLRNCKPLVLGRRLGHTPATMKWVAAWIERAVRKISKRRD